MENNTNINGFANTNQMDVKCFFQGKDESMEYYIDGGKIDNFRTIWDNGYELSHLNRENQLEQKEMLLVPLKDTLMKTFMWETKRMDAIYAAAKKVANKEKELQKTREDYKKAKAFFSKNTWIFSSKEIPEWAGQRVVEDNLDIIAGEGGYLKMELAILQNKHNVLVEEYQFDKYFGIGDIQWICTKMARIQDDINYGAKSFMADDEEEYFFNGPTRKENTLPNDSWTDEQLCMWISTTEGGIGMRKAEEILDGRYAEYIERMQKLTNEKANSCESMADYYAMANQFAAVSGLKYEAAKIEDRGIVRENKAEVYRLRSLVAEEKTEKMVFVPGDLCWYTASGKETKNPNKVAWGYSDIKLVPQHAMFDAMANRAYDALQGSIGINYRQAEETVDELSEMYAEVLRSIR